MDPPHPPPARRTPSRPGLGTRLIRAPYIRGIPELDLLPDDQTRERVIKEIEHAMLPRSLREVASFLFAVALFLAVPGLVGYVIAHVALSAMGVWNGRVFYAILLAGYLVIVVLALRRDLPKQLRRRLIEMSIPVCLRCGYDLRGAPCETSRCPECGRRLSSIEGTAIREWSERDSPHFRGR